MKITGLQIYRFSLPVSPILVGKRSLKIREGFILKLMGESGFFGFGEASPLPGLNIESREKVQSELLRAQKFFIGKTIPSSFKGLSGLKISPSTQWGLDMATLNLIGQTKRTSFANLISKDASPSLRMNGLLDGTEKDIYRNARVMVKAGYTILKLKVGRDSIIRDIRKVELLKDIVGQKAKIILDANRHWNFKQAVEFGREFDNKNIEYIEEPISDTSKLIEFYKATKLPFALDESLKKFKYSQLSQMEGLNTIIIKPTVLGGLGQILNLIELVKRLHIKAVVSSSFETGIGLTALAHLSAGFSSIVSHAGLDTRKFLKEDLLEDSRMLTSPKLNLSKILRIQNKINFNLLSAL